MADTFGHRFIRARKAHECYACRDPILPGTIYSTWCSVNDGFWRGKLHTGCADLWQCCDDSDDGLGPDWMVDYLGDLGEKDLEEDLAKTKISEPEANRIRAMWRGLPRLPRGVW
jgi:hypothetical protein